MKILETNMENIRSLCEKHKVGSLFVFGSVLSEKFTDVSDIDFVVSFKDIELLDYADNYFDFKFSLEDLLKRKIDLLEEQAIRNPYLKKSIDTSKLLIYG